MMVLVVLRVAVKARVYFGDFSDVGCWESNWVGHLEEARVAGVTTGSAIRGLLWKQCMVAFYMYVYMAV